MKSGLTGVLTGVNKVRAFKTCIDLRGAEIFLCVGDSDKDFSLTQSGMEIGINRP